MHELCALNFDAVPRLLARNGGEKDSTNIAGRLSLATDERVECGVTIKTPRESSSSEERPDWAL
jgi:hypothetical protein